MAGEWKSGRLLNVGCGHGPDFVPFKDNFELHGIDFSMEMLRQARRYSAKFGFYAHLVHADMTDLPYNDGSFDHAIAIASVHHLKGRTEQLKALRELYRVLKPGAESLLTVWNRWQRRFWFAGKETLVPWKSKTETLDRYYYLFSYTEIAGLARDAGFVVLEEFPEHSYHGPFKTFSRNICLRLKKRP